MPARAVRLDRAGLSEARHWCSAGRAGGAAYLCSQSLIQPVGPCGHEAVAMWRLVGIDFGHEPISDETRICRFRVCSKQLIVNPAAFAHFASPNEVFSLCAQSHHAALRESVAPLSAPTPRAAPPFGRALHGITSNRALPPACWPHPARREPDTSHVVRSRNARYPGLTSVPGLVRRH